jgi:hypothetical protein
LPCSCGTPLSGSCSYLSGSNKNKWLYISDNKNNLDDTPRDIIVTQNRRKETKINGNTVAEGRILQSSERHDNDSCARDDASCLTMNCFYVVLYHANYIKLFVEVRFLNMFFVI